MNNNVSRLIKLMEEKVSYLMQINELTLLHQVLIEQEDFYKLIDSLDKRENIIKQLNETDKLIKNKYGSFESWNEKGNAEFSQQFNSLKSIEANFNNILKELNEKDQKSKLALSTKTEEFKGSIRGISNSKKTFNAYNKTNMQMESLYFDKNK